MPDAPALVESPAPRRAPPALVGFGVDRGLVRLVSRSASAAEVIDVPTIGGIATRARVPLSDARWCAAAVTSDGWAVYTQDTHELRVTAAPSSAPWHAAHGVAPRGFALTAHVAPGEPLSGALPVTLDRDPCVLVASPNRADRQRGQRLRVFGPDLVTDHTPAWYAPLSARALLAAGATVLGPLAVLATDRDDEVDVCAFSPEAPSGSHHTVSLGRGQRFECAAAGAGKIVVVSRGGDGLVVRTLARDLRSELNPVPIAARTGWRIGAVRCAYAHGPFVIAHAEHTGTESAVVVTAFDGRVTSSVRVPFPTVDALGVDGGDVVVAALVEGASAPLLMVYKLRLRGQRRDGAPASRGVAFSPRAYAYLLEQPSCRTAVERRAVLADLARLVAFSLGVRAPTALWVRRGDATSDTAVLTIPGADPDQDVTIGLRVRADGSAAADVRIGTGARAAPLPVSRAARSSGVLARLLAAVGAEEPDPDSGTRLELASVGASIEAIVSAVFGLRCTR